MQREDCRGGFQKKNIFDEAEEIASLDINFLGGFIEGISVVNFFWAISTLLVLFAGKASRVLVDR